MEIIRVASDDQDLKQLLQTYEHEFSAITGKNPDQNGDYELDVDLAKTDNFLLKLDQRKIGFCIKTVSHGRHDILEFYVQALERGQKIGEQFAHEIFKMYPGQWQVRQIEGADKARSFWRKTINSFTSGQYKEETVVDEYWGKVSKQTFTSA